MNQTLRATDVDMKLPLFSEFRPVLHHGDCAEVLKTIDDESVDLVVTSPPYAAQRKNTYGGITADKYVEWFLPIAAELKRVLKTTGSFCLNIYPHCEDGIRHRYVTELELALRDQGWRLVDTFIWRKKVGMPGGWNGRLKSEWEPIFHFTKAKGFHWDTEGVRVKSVDRIDRQREYERFIRKYGKDGKEVSRTGSGFNRDADAIKLREDGTVLPGNVLDLAVVHPVQIEDTLHSAAFPIGLPQFFISLLSPKGGVVLDPFLGSGTTVKAAYGLDRHSIGIEQHLDYIEATRKHFDFGDAPNGQEE